MNHSCNHTVMTNAICTLALNGFKAAEAGHLGKAMDMAAVASVLFIRFLKFDTGDHS